MAKRNPTKKLESLSDPLKPALKTKSRARDRKNKRAGEHERRAELITRRNDLLPRLQLVKRSTSELLVYSRSLRRHDLGLVLEMANSIATKGYISPIVIGRDGKTILDGEIRLKAAQHLGIEALDCLLLEHMTDAEERATRIALNRIGQRREWDFELLKVELEELIVIDEPLELLGFDNVELDQILYQEDDDAGPAGEPGHLPLVTERGDIWILGEHRVICGDAREEAVYSQLMAGETAQAMVTDPPYNKVVASIVSTRHEEFAFASGEMSPAEFETFLLGFLTAAIKTLDAGAIAYIFMDWVQIECLLRTTRESGFEYLNLVAWVKANAGMGSFLRSQHELVVMAKRPGPHNNRIQLGSKGRNRSNVWFAPGAGTIGTEARELLAEHPTSKPVGLLVDALLDITEPGDVVIDPFGGSGSTLMAAERSKRRARLIEYEPGYCDLIVRRWQIETERDAVLETSGQTYCAVAEDRGAGDHADADQEDGSEPGKR